jgi:ArsR family transcriptional regulator, nickel/cobalt-responsive transcriptional repressor
MPHPSEHSPVSRPLAATEAAEIAESMGVFATPSRVRLLYALLGRPQTVEQLAAACRLEASAASHQLRLLRQLRFVVAEREGRHVRYRLHNHHVAELLAAIRHHHEHAVHGWTASAESSEVGTELAS